MRMHLSEITSTVEGRLSGKDREVCSVSIDTRTLSQDDLYIAIKGSNFDGHVFIAQAEASGASAVVVEKEFDTKLPQIIVKETRIALAKLAALWKKKAQVITIAVTGSNGKTTVKEMVASILKIKASVLSTKGNLNNDIGVPLTLLELDQQHQYAVIEMGANHPGDIEYSAHYTKPDVAIITNVAAAHLEGFGTLKGVAIAKGEIIQSLDDEGVAILNKEDDFYPYWEQVAGTRKRLTFGLDEMADIYANEISSGIENKQFVTRFDLVNATDKVAIQLKLAGKHNVMNALAAAASCLSIGIELQQIKQGLEDMKPVAGRLEPIIGEKDNLIINDSYNANPGSMKAALNVLVQCKGVPWVILGALAEMGQDRLKIHHEIGDLIKSKNIVRLLAMGSDAKASCKAFGKGATFFSSQEQLIEVLKQEITGDETLLIKGSRMQKMENVVAALTNKYK